LLVIETFVTRRQRGDTIAHLSCDLGGLCGEQGCAESTRGTTALSTVKQKRTLALSR
jgi:hypothetical protein